MQSPEARRVTVEAARVASDSFPLAVSLEEADRRCRRALMEAWVGRETLTAKLPPSRLALDPGDVVSLSNDGRLIDYRITRIADAGARAFEAIRTDATIYDPPPGQYRPANLPGATVYGPADVVLMDLPQLDDTVPAHRPYAAVFAKPWYGTVAIWRSAAQAGFALLDTLGVPARMTNHYYTDWRDVPDKLWRWTNFSPEEIACRGDGTIRINEAALDKLQALRDRLDVPMIIHSAYRSPDYDRQVGGAKHSMHLQGAAFDISMVNHDPERFEVEARVVGFTGFGFYPRQNFMHIDIGRSRQWGDPFPPRATRGGRTTRSGRTTRFAPEPPHPRESLSESRTMKGGGAAGLATIGAAGTEVVQQAVADTQSALQLLIPYLHTMRWAFIAVALIGVSVTIYARWDDWRKGRR